MLIRHKAEQILRRTLRAVRDNARRSVVWITWMAHWFAANRAFNRAVRDQAAALVTSYGEANAYAEAARLRNKAVGEEAQLFAFNVEVMTAEVAGVSLDRPDTRILGPEPPLWALPFVSAATLSFITRIGTTLLGQMRVRAAPATGSVVRSYMENRLDHPLTLGLTPRQVECLRWAAEGKSSTDIAAIVGISPKTVDFHLDLACKKLGVRTRAQAVKIAAQAQILGEPSSLTR